MSSSPSLRRRLPLPGALLLLQAVLLLLFGILARYDAPVHARNPAHSRDGASQPLLDALHPLWRDMHFMVLAGFGLLLAAARRHSAAAGAGTSLLAAGLVFQWALLMGNFLYRVDGKVMLNIVTLVRGDLAAGAVLVSLGAVLGAASPLQVLGIAFAEVVAFTINEYLAVKHYKAVDCGLSILVHCFGAYFGLAVSVVLGSGGRKKDADKHRASHGSDLFFMAGVLVLLSYWPSWNSLLAAGDDRHRALVNTYVALGAAVTSAGAASTALSRTGKMSMGDLASGGVAGCVGVGAAAHLMLYPVGAAAVGAVCGVIAVIGEKFIAPFLASKLRVRDTLGIHSRHGLPGIVAAVTSVIMAAKADYDDYGYSYYQIYPARAPEFNSTLLSTIQGDFSIAPGVGRGGSRQAGYQLAALVTTLAIAIAGGIITGLLMKIPLFTQIPDPDEATDGDEVWWEQERQGSGSGGGGESDV